MSADARVARAIIEVRRELDRQYDVHRRPVPQELHDAIHDLINEAMDALHLTGDDIETYR